MKAIFATGLLLLALAGNLFAGNSLYIDNSEDAEYEIINLSAEDIGNLLAKDDPVLVFKKQSETLKMVSAGDLVVAGACKEIPDGFIRKVISIREEKGRVVIETVGAGFEDMLKGKVAVPGKKEMNHGLSAEK